MKLHPAKAVGVFCVLLGCTLFVNCGGGSSSFGKSASLTQIVISPANKSIPKGTNLQLMATGMFSDGSQQNLSASVTWQASPSSVAAITAQGKLSGMGMGVAHVSAAYEGVTGTASITIGAAALVSISIGIPQTTLPQGETESLKATGTFTDASTQDLTASVTWQAGPSTIATINAQGDLKGLNMGAAQVTAASQGVTGAASLNIGPAALLQISVVAPRSSLPDGETEVLTATGNFSDGSTKDLTQQVTWQANPPAIATITAQGQLSGRAQGMAQVSAAYGGVTGTAAVTIGSAALLQISVSAPMPSLPDGETESLTATGTFSDGSTKDLTQLATWQANPPGVASINAQGQLSGRARGVAQASATYNGVTGAMSVTIGSPALLNLVVGPSGSSLPLGETQALTATGTFSDGTLQNLTQQAVWSSSQPAIASVVSAGQVEGKALGSTLISAVAGSVTGTTSLTVTAPVIVGLSLSPAQTSLTLGSIVQLHAIATFSDGSTQDVTASATWSSEQANIVAVIGGLATADQVGSATIQATDGGFTGTSTLTVTPLMIVSYFNRANSVASGIDGTIRLTNSGFPPGDLCAMVYVFDDSQEMNECCGCTISDNGLLTLSLLKDLTANSLTGKAPSVGTIMIVPADPGQGGQCNAGSPSPDRMIEGWETNVQGASGVYQLSEISSGLSPLGSTEAQVLAADCGLMQQLGSGSGTCTCGTGD
jgi:hypothetical protein